MTTTQEKELLKSLWKVQDELSNEEEIDTPEWLYKWYEVKYKISVAKGNTYGEIRQEFRDMVSDINNAEEAHLSDINNKKVRNTSDEDFIASCEYELEICKLEKLIIAKVMNCYNLDRWEV